MTSRRVAKVLNQVAHKRELRSKLRAQLAAVEQELVGLAHEYRGLTNEELPID